MCLGLGAIQGVSSSSVGEHKRCAKTKEQNISDTRQQQDEYQISIDLPETPALDMPQGTDDARALGCDGGWSALTGGVIVVPAPPAEGGPRAQRGHRAIVCKKCCMLCVLHIED